MLDRVRSRAQMERSFAPFPIYPLTKVLLPEHLQARCFGPTIIHKLLEQMRTTILALLMLSTLSPQLQAQCWRSVSAGGNHTLAIDGNGGLWAWGRNEFGQIGDGTSTTRSAPVVIDTVNSYILVSAGMHHSLAIRSDSTLWGWGRNTWGAIGDGTESNRTVPVQVGSADNWLSVEASHFHSVGLRSDGSIWAWGSNGNAQLGNGTQDGSIGALAPAQVEDDFDWTAISAGDNHSIGIRQDGTMWVWGSNVFDALGDPTFAVLTLPTQIGSDDDWDSVNAGENHNLAIRTDGTLWGWGRNFFGALGTGGTADETSPILISDATDWISISANTYHSAALNASGELFTFGANQFGQLGDGTTIADPSVEHQMGTANWLSVSIGFSHSTAIQEDGTLWAWGGNGNGQVGDGSFIDRNLPVEIACPTYLTTGVAAVDPTMALNIYPNPASDRVFVSGVRGHGSWAVLHTLGGTVISGGSSLEGGLDISGLPAGCYFLQWQGPDGARTVRFNKL